jgi:hypothetical protein
MGMIRDLRKMAVTLKDSPDILDQSRSKILTTVFGQHLSKADEDFLFGVISGLRSEMNAEKLVPPGQVIVVSSEEHYSAAGGNGGDSLRIVARDVTGCLERRFGEIWFGKGMFADHSPKHYESVLGALQCGVINGSA